MPFEFVDVVLVPFPFTSQKASAAFFYGLKPGTAIYHTLAQQPLDVITIEDLCTALPSRFRRIRGITGGGGATH